MSKKLLILWLLVMGTFGVATMGCSDDDDDTTVDASSEVDSATGTDDAATSADAGSEDATTTDAGQTVVYAPCNFDPQPSCEAPYDLCNVFGGGSAPHHCTYTCETVASCPDPADGTATLVCEQGDGSEDVCQLDCSSGTCPSGMSCISTGTAGETKRCAYNP